MVYLTIASSRIGLLKDCIFIALAKLGGHNLVLHCHSGNYGHFYSEATNLVKWLCRTAIGSADKLVILSELFRSDFKFLNEKCVKIIVVHNTSDISTSILHNQRSTTQIKSKLTPKKPVRILYLSNLIESKGYLVQLEAARRLVHDHQVDLRVHFCGDFILVGTPISYRTSSDAMADFLTRIRKYDLTDHIVFSETVTGDEKLMELEEADIFILPTTYRNEAQPVSIIEALAYGCVVISTNHRAIPEMLDYGKAGIILSSAEPDKITAAVLELVHDPALIEQFSTRAEIHYHRHYSQEAHWQKLRAILDV